ncbi:MAG: hypothetical protein KDK39_02090 [Leptospiraceae bacterium]|nr:hypothetical protein [Leptospiraceae bacterium]
MEDFFEQIPPGVREHIRGITRTSGLPDSDESLDLMAEAWLGKKEAFEREIESRRMQEIDTLAVDAPQGAVVMTYSGSLLNLGAVQGAGRPVEYNSIGIRGDVPDAARHQSAVLAQGLELDHEVVFQTGPVQSTSPAFKIAVCNDDLGLEEQAEQLSNVTMVLTREFADINKTLVL